jgi:endonuclease/exonuclease/phosphatase family metal-dependent hydrolase
MRRALVVSVVLCVLLSGAASAQHDDPPPERTSPPGQIQVLTVNARQFAILDLGLFTRLFELVRAVRSRPDAFDGGPSGAVATPDVVIFQELRFSNLEIFDRILDQRSASAYEIVSLDGGHTRLLINTSTVTLASEPQLITDPCRTGTGEEPAKRYIWARFTENATGAPFVVVGVHFKAQYEETGQENCPERNIQAIRSAIAAETAPVILGGDFNKRAMEMARECDPDEQSAPLPWWSSLTAPTDGSRSFVDAVQSHHRATGDVMTHEWTFERGSEIVVCDGNYSQKRTRLDYLFASGAAVGDAHADHPGWAGEPPGTENAHNPRYSDHRFVWGRFVISGPPQPAPPVASTAAEGVVNLTWQAQEGVTGWVLYRAGAARDYVALRRLTPDITTFSDTSTKHGVTYRYALAPIGPDQGQGVESEPAFAVADALGPRVVGRRPPNGSRDARRWIPIDVFFDEGIDPESVKPHTVSLYRKGRRVAGNLVQVSARRLRFNPYNNLGKDKVYWVVVRPTRDNLGNLGVRDVFNFRTK